MWMMGYNDAGELLNNNNININIQDSFNGRRLRQLMPRPPTTSTTLIHAGTHDLLALNHHFEEQNKRVLNNNNNNTQQIVVSSRWNPTPEQLQTLEELYRRGTRTPSAEQIQLITAQLRRYGKIEGKNVFYWFQNHKARERQKRRRQLHQPPPLSDNHNGEKKDSSLTGANRSVYEVEQTKNWASPTNSSTIAPEKQGRSGAPTECKGADDGWLQFDYNNNNNNNNEEEEAAAAAEEEEITTILQQRKNATWQQMMHLSCSSSSSPAPITTTTTTTIQSTTMVMPKDKHLNILLEPYGSNGRGGGEEAAATQTLQLFPLLGDGDEKDNASTMMDSTTNHHVTPYPFFEFLPLKN
ncbi:hypothetical protein ACJIZ3_004521 [Penstemon smallii]|uniref:Homeobox domain-containing protein n=1 Tax=Penstemon smallii TaxID=265156 RepID=A0ABD3S2A6_9LAMI